MPLPCRALLFVAIPALLYLTGLDLGPGFSALLVLALSWAFLRQEGRRLSSLGLKLDTRWGLDFLLGAALGLGLLGLMALGLRALGAFHWEPNPAFRPTRLLSGLALFALVAVHEECLFRGYPFQRLVESWGAWPAQLLLAGLFALAHWGNTGLTAATRPLATLNIALAALLMGLCYLRTRSLAMPMGLHLGWNWAQGCLLGFPVSGTTLVQSPWRSVLHGGPPWLTGGAFGLEASVICTGIGLGTLCALGLWKGRPEPDGRVRGEPLSPAS